MKRKYGAALQRETLAEQGMRLRAQEMHNNSYNYGTTARKGSPSRGKRRGLAFKPMHRR